MIAQQKVDSCNSGWIVTFLMIVRNGGPSSGYVSTGFFGGKLLSNSSLSCAELFFH